VPAPVQTTFEVDGVEFPSISTRVERNQAFIFARFLGLVSQTVPAEAEAACVPADQLGICPFYIQSPDPNDVPSSTNPNGSFGLELNKIYRFKFGSNPQQSDGQTGGNRGFLSIFGSGGNDLRDAIENGCVGADPDFTVSEGMVLTDTKPGNMASIWNSIADLYSYETAPQRSACNIPFDETLFIGKPYDFAVNPQLPPGTTLDQIIENCNDDPDPNDNVNGRLWPIAISDQITGLTCGGNGRCDVELSHLAVMYIVCYPPDHGPNDCDGENPGQSALYGMFRLAEKLSLKVSGMSNNILAPRHVVLVK
jgi:hypothetical protein